jgi:hypothetical protein
MSIGQLYSYTLGRDAEIVVVDDSDIPHIDWGVCG